jgi:hypothetical protein
LGDDPRDFGFRTSDRSRHQLLLTQAADLERRRRRQRRDPLPRGRRVAAQNLALVHSLTSASPRSDGASRWTLGQQIALPVKRKSAVALRWLLPRTICCACHLMGGAALPLSDDDAEVARMAPISWAPAP